MQFSDFDKIPNLSEDQLKQELRENKVYTTLSGLKCEASFFSIILEGLFC